MNFNSPPGGYASQLAWSVTGIQELNRRVTAILENGGGGILPTLQQVTDAGNTTTATINATEFATFSDAGTIGISITTKPNGGRSNIIFVQESGTAAIKCNPLTDDVTQAIQNKSGTIALLENFGYNVFTVSIGIGDTNFTLPVDHSTGNVLVGIIPANSSNSAEVLKGGFWAQDNDTNYVINLLVPSTIAGDCDFYVTSFNA